MKRLTIWIALASMSIGMMAAPARRINRLITLSDGTQVMAMRVGDEWGERWQTADGERYVMHEGVATKETNAEKHSLLRKAAAQTQAIGERALQVPRVPVIMVNFANQTFAHDATLVDSMFNAEQYHHDGATGSVQQYYCDQSNGQYCPQFDIYGPVTLSQNYSYYGANSGGSSSSRAGYMVTEACALADSLVDFTLYDSNNDNVVDLVFVLYAGFGENDPPTDAQVSTTIDAEGLVWPHWFTVTSAGYGSNQRVFDGKTINAYECSNELDGYATTSTHAQLTGIGVLVHEFGHALGLTDLYNTVDQMAHKTMGMWSVMDYGSFNNDLLTPPCLTAYERFFLGWATPTLLNTPLNDTLPAWSETGESRLITAEGILPADGSHPSPATYWTLENRQKTGWDAGLPGSGLMITKVTYSQSKWSSNSINNTKTAMGVDLIEADGKAPSYKESKRGWAGKQGDLFPYDTINYFTPVEQYPLTEIAQANGVVTYLFMGGAAADTTHQDSTSTALPMAVEQQRITAIYSIDGCHMGTNINTLPRGVFIIRRENGDTEKRIVK